MEERADDADAALAESQRAERSRRTNVMEKIAAASTIPAVVVTLTDFAMNNATRVLEADRILGVLGLVVGIAGVLVGFTSLATARRTARSSGDQERAIHSLQEHGHQSLAVLGNAGSDDPRRQPHEQ